MTVQVVILDEAVDAKDDDDDDLIHIVCPECNEDLAFCGVDVSDRPYKSWDSYPDPRDCVVCHELGKCPECGE